MRAAHARSLGLARICLSLAALHVAVAPAHAQGGATRPWEISFVVGATGGNQPTGGTSLDTFPAGDAFTTMDGEASRYASTWFFGDGARLLNEIAQTFTAIPVNSRLTPLDPALTRAGIDRSRGATFGVRVVRRLTSRLGVEFAVDSTASSLAIRDEIVDMIDATRDSYGPTWLGIIATGGNVLFTNGAASATATVTREASGRQTRVTGAVRLGLTEGERLSTYATAGFGVTRRPSESPEVRLTGTYSFLLVDIAPFAERDEVLVRFDVDSSVPTGVFGGGFTYDLNARSGIGADVRIYLSGNGVDTIVGATPSRTLHPLAFAIGSALSPAIVFSNTSEVRSNLTGPPISELRTFTGSGIETQFGVTFNYFFRF